MYKFTPSVREVSEADEAAYKADTRDIVMRLRSEALARKEPWWPQYLTSDKVVGQVNEVFAELDERNQFERNWRDGS